MNKKKNNRQFKEDISGSSNLFVDKTKSIVTLKILKFTSTLKDSLQHSGIRVTAESLLLNIVLLFH